MTTELTVLDHQRALGEFMVKLHDTYLQVHQQDPTIRMGDLLVVLGLPYLLSYPHFTVFCFNLAALYYWSDLQSNQQPLKKACNTN